MAPLMATGTLLLIGLVALTEWEILRGFAEVDSAANRQRELLQDLAEVRGVEKSMIDMESGTRGFLLTGREEFLEPAQRGEREFDAAAATLRERWSGQAERLATLEHVEALSLDWRKAFQRPLLERRRAARGAADAAAIDEIVARGEGRKRVDGVRGLCDHLENRLAAEIRAASFEVNRLTEDARDFALRAGLALLLAVAFMAAVIARGFRAAAERNEVLRREVAVRQEAEERARASETRFAAFLNGLSEALVIVDDRETVTWSNPRLPELFGKGSGTHEGTSVLALVSGDDAPRLREALAGMRAGAGTRAGLEATARRADGEAFAAEFAMSRFETAHGPRVALVIRDISERRAVERLKSEFIASVSHELRTPLTAIVGSLSLLRSGEAGELEGAARAFVDMAHANSLRLARLVDDVIDVERVGSGALAFRSTEFPLPAFLAEAVRLNQGFAEAHGVFLFLDEPVPAATLRGDRDRLMQAVTNLLSNAAKFSPRDEEVRIAATLAAGAVRICVADRGPGIPEAFRPRVFEKFAQADSSDSREKGGTGLGLSIARAIVERMGGRIGFDSESGRGTTFWIEMPAAREGGGP
ncbi:MAG: hypothetical protein C3F16_10180 [Betaproteobacteria bacterium]|nr:MAG: hypothetical protein C3F16_10180 [Betaproteobacteria bacterium]